MRYHLVRSTATALLWIAAIEIVSSFVVKQLFDYTFSFTPYFFGIGLFGLLLFIVSRFISG